MTFPIQSSRILVVDDISRNLQVVGTVLRNSGYHVLPATSGAQALESVQLKRPDLILLDLMMPDMDGLEVCRRLKREEGTKHIPIIFLTASNEMDHLIKGFAEGAVDYVTKPFNTPELLARVRTHLELMHARQRLREINDEKNEFMGIVAHDLRNPVSAIQGYAETVLEDQEQLPREVTDIARRIQELARRMTEMLQNLLNANALERGELTVRTVSCDIRNILKEVIEAAGPRAQAKGQTIHFFSETSELRALLDRNIASQIFENLISNALKYSPPNSEVTVRVIASGSKIRCEVADDGPGISPEDQQRLFGKFARLSAKPTGGESSTGLGLSIVKKLVEAMSGEVWCESELGKGAAFIVEFPAERIPVP